MNAYRIDWGVTAVFAIPLAIGFVPAQLAGDGWANIIVHVGPLYVAFAWRAA